MHAWLIRVIGLPSPSESPALERTVNEKPVGTTGYQPSTVTVTLDYCWTGSQELLGWYPGTRGYTKNRAKKKADCLGN
eukprot:3934137-Rhodomonas_salina.1